MNLQRAVPLLCMLAAAPAVAAGPVRTQIQTLDNNQFKMRFDVDVKASSAAVWGVLTDFDHHAQRLPYLTRSKVVFKNWDYAIVDQEGQVKWLFWTFTVWVQQKVVETPMTEAAFQAVDGDFSILRGSWTLSGPGAGPTLLACDLVMQPRRHIPAWAVRWAAKKYLGAMVGALATAAEKH